MATDYNYLFKLVLVGDSGVGKTSLLLRYTDDTFTINHIATIGVDFKIKTMDMGDSNSRTRLQVWDTAGQDRFKTIVASFYRGADGLIVVFDVTEMESFEHVTQWFKEAQQSGNEEKLCSRLLIGNKSDLTAKRTVPFDTAQALADKMGVPYIETSAKDTTNVEQAFTSMAHRIFEVKKTNPPLLEDSNGRLNELDHLGKLRKGYCENRWDSTCSC